MSLLKRTFRYIYIHLFKNPRYFFTYALNFFNPGYVPDISYYERDELVGLLKTGKSIIRIGDGEVYLMNFGTMGYQDYDPKLRDLFFQLTKEYKSSSPYILCFNKIPLEKTNRQLKRDNLFNCWLPMKVYYQLYFDKRAKYGDATMFYFNETFPIYFESYLKTKHLILVTRSENIDKFRGNKSIPFTHVSYIEAPAHNSFSVYDILKNKIRNEVEKYGKEDSIVIMAFGPSCKPMAYELSKEGIVTIDVGKGIEVAYTDERIDQLIYPV